MSPLFPENLAACQFTCHIKELHQVGQRIAMVTQFFLHPFATPALRDFLDQERHPARFIGQSVQHGATNFGSK